VDINERGQWSLFFYLTACGVWPLSVFVA